MATKKRRTSLPNQRTSAQGSVKTTCLSLLRSTFSISLFRPAKADFGTRPWKRYGRRTDSTSAVRRAVEGDQITGSASCCKAMDPEPEDFVPRHGGEDTALRALRAGKSFAT